MKTFSFFILLLLLIPISLFSQSKNQAVEITTDFNQDGDITFISENKNHCDYYIWLDFSLLRGYNMNQPLPYTATVKDGTRRLFTIKRMSDSVSPTYSWTYRVYKGNANAKLNLDFVFSLPVKSGDSIQAMTSITRDFGIEFDFSHAGDTVYACREGRVCDVELIDQTSKRNTIKRDILIYHKDGSFSEYSLFYDELLVYPGDYVELGQPIAVVNKENKHKRLNFSVYFLDKNKVKNDEIGNKYTHLVPVFHTANAGDLKLEEKMVYISEITENQVIQEMSNKEKKKYKKDKQKR